MLFKYISGSNLSGFPKFVLTEAPSNKCFVQVGKPVLNTYEYHAPKHVAAAYKAHHGCIELYKLGYQYAGVLA